MSQTPESGVRSGTLDDKGVFAINSVDGGTGRLLRLAAIATELGADRLAEEAKDLAGRVAEGRFYVACVGQFKRGKSTLIGALVGENLLPTGFVPVTAVPTVIRFGNQRTARVRLQDGSWRDIAFSDLQQYVSEEHNPENAKRVAGVEVFINSPLLATGMCLVDTPGLGSVFAGNSASTQAFIPQIDAALVVVGADPPLAGEELSLVEAVGRQVAHLLIALNKADRTTEAERAAAEAFTLRLLQKRLGRNVGPVFQVSATERLEGHGPERDWNKLVRALEDLVERSGRALVRSACERGIQRIAEQILAIVSEERDALLRPLEESERRIAAMRQTIAEADQSIRQLGYLLTAEQRHLSDLFLNQRKAFLGAALPEIHKEFDAVVTAQPRTFGPSYRRSLMRAAQQIVHLRVLPWLEVEQQRAEEAYQKVAQRFVDMGNAFLKKLADAGIPELARVPHALDSQTGFRVKSEFQFRSLIEVAQPASPLRWLADALISFAQAYKFIEQDAREFLEHLMEINSTRVQSDVVNRVQESRSKLEVEIRKLLLEISRIAEHALEHARRAKAEGTPAVEAALVRLADITKEIVELQERTYLQ
jgi:hypothetical protein